jgi:hypothetical protein
MSQLSQHAGDQPIEPSRYLRISAAEALWIYRYADSEPKAS